MTQQAQARLDGLLSFLEQDPENPHLLKDAAGAAMGAGQSARAHELYQRLAELGTLDDQDRNAAGMAAMRSGHAEQAVEHFSALSAKYPGEAGLRYNLAHSLSLAGDEAAAEELLDPELIEMLPQAALLKIEIMHRDGRFEEAAELGRRYLERHPDYPPLLAAMSVLALDVEDTELARRCAEAAGDHPDALTTLATLRLGEQDAAGADAMFRKALAMNAHPQPRALIGVGLSAMATGDMKSASEYLDRGAEIFEDHLGSWIASGWAYLLAGNLEMARARFQHALDLDPNFAESHGSLAVLDLMEGDLDMARTRTELAQRLDRSCFSGALAKSLILSAEGDKEKAARIVEMAMKQPMGDGSQTLGELIAMNLAGGGPTGST